MADMQSLKAEEGESSSTIVVEAEEIEPAVVPSVRMKLKKPKPKKKVAWSSDTVDNENMNKKKSKCCCIYEKPRMFGESSSESDDDECEHCKGHIEKKHHSKPKPSSDENHIDHISPDNKENM
ncbi:E3 ubiquitin-protein ligase PPP1R11-like [Argiope bruennichi]|uniref:E3 ubiquitin-protein ligase PPP1R11 n=1 Tax=Argiope bruennichi TaxID=94029 RepID=A0A8T0E7Y4_ARGBR|nr:E3 ubiquitin-protein ligase PPP1R11-like [Argiope bruennichi]KAF8766581.1 E3 ubiquitin-protein ligase PPP1R11 like protein [Argiope bruennichi]